MHRTIIVIALSLAACGGDPMRAPSPPGSNGAGSPGAGGAQVDSGPASAALDASAGTVNADTGTSRSADAGASQSADTGASQSADTGASGSPDATSSGHSPTWSRDIAPLIARCTGYCHPGQYSPMPLTVREGYESLINVPSVQCSTGMLRVAPGDADASYLMAKITGRGLCGGSRMPPGSAKLPEGDIDVIRRWINAGAHL